MPIGLASHQPSPGRRTSAGRLEKAQARSSGAAPALPQNCELTTFFRPTKPCDTRAPYSFLVTTL
jgi:hypothetical protein